MRIEYGARSDQGQVRDSNEDAYIANEPDNTFLVADGMGGHAAGEIASQLAAETTVKFLKGHGPDSDQDLDTLMQQAVHEANANVYETQKQQPECRGMGSTLTAITFSDDRFHIAHVGDSRAYLLRNGILNQLTRDHSVVWPLYENGILTKEDISKHPQKNLITRSIGTTPRVEVDSCTDTIAGGDIFLLCSDGLTDVLTDQDIAEILSDPLQNVQDLTTRLINKANEAGGPDNITVVVVRLFSGN